MENLNIIEKLQKKLSEIIEDSENVALIFKEFLVPALGHRTVIFPSTYSTSEDSKNSTYNIDTIAFSDSIKNVCTIDSYQSQANRMEELLLKKYSSLLCASIELSYEQESQSEQKPKHILEIGHRISDAFLKAADGYETNVEKKILQKFDKKDVTEIAIYAPTSLLFGFWDSRGITTRKSPAVIRSIIRAYNVDELKKGVSYTPPFKFDYERENLSEKKATLSKEGFLQINNCNNLGGVVSHGDIIREVSINLEIIRSFSDSNPESEMSKTLRNYLLALSLVLVTAPINSTLRQGCILVRDNTHAPQLKIVRRTSIPEEISLNHDELNKVAETLKQAFYKDERQPIQLKVSAEKIKKYKTQKKLNSGEEERPSKTRTKRTNR